MRIIEHDTYFEIIEDFPGEAEIFLNQTHKHKCGYCERVWEHKNSSAGNKRAHICSCGSIQFEKYDGPEPPSDSAK